MKQKGYVKTSRDLACPFFLNLTVNAVIDDGSGPMHPS